MRKSNPEELMMNSNNSRRKETLSDNSETIRISQQQVEHREQQQHQLKYQRYGSDHPSPYNYHVHSTTGENNQGIFSLRESTEISEVMSISNHSTNSTISKTMLAPIASSSASNLPPNTVSILISPSVLSPAQTHPLPQIQSVISRRISTPNENDVLSGRGGGINSHTGNIIFRNWVKDRKENYNLAPSKIEKANVSREIVNLVSRANGRFLRRDELDFADRHTNDSNISSQCWVEIEDVQAMAKTSQALREGAPAIRSAAKEKTRVIGQGKTRLKKKKFDSKFSKKSKEMSPHDIINRLIVDGKRNKKEDENTMTEEEQMEKVELESCGHILTATPVVPQTIRTLLRLSSEPLYQSEMEIQTEISSTNLSTYFQNGNDNAIVSLENTPNLLPVTSTREPPELSFPLPPTSFSLNPLPPVFSKPKKTLYRSHSLALSDLPEPDLSNHHDSILLDHDSTFTDYFTCEESVAKFWSQQIEDNPDFSRAATSSFTSGKSTASVVPVSSVNSEALIRKLDTIQRSNRNLNISMSYNSNIYTSMSDLFPSEDDSIINNYNNEKKTVCYCLCDGRDGASKELCPCNQYANSLLTGELNI